MSSDMMQLWSRAHYIGGSEVDVPEPHHLPCEAACRCRALRTFNRGQTNDRAGLHDDAVLCNSLCVCLMSYTCRVVS